MQERIPRQTKRDLLNKFILLNWLRPENVIFNVKRSFSLQKLNFERPSLDVSCGDGLFSFITAGGSLSPEFDRFIFLDTEGFHQGVDIHDNYLEDFYKVPITEEPHYQFDFGTDWKHSMLDKASALNFYKELIEHDNNDKFEFPDQSFQTIYSNSLYWIENIEQCLSEFKRMLLTGGKILLHVIMPDILDIQLPKDLKFGDEWHRIIDRGRRASYKSFKEKNWWLNLFEKLNLRIMEIVPTFSKMQANIWNIGLRPIVPFLIEMSNLIDKNDRDRIKAEYCDIISRLIPPFINIDVHEKDSVDFLFVLSK